MLGHMVYTEQKGRKPEVELERVRGLSFLRASIPAPAGTSAAALRRRVVRAARLLHKAGVRRVLTTGGFAHWDVLREWELARVDTAPFCQALAARLALAALERMDVPPGTATVALRGGRVSRPFFQAAMELAPAVRALVVTSPNGGEALSAYLRREYGVPVLEECPGAAAHLTLEFSILKGGAGECITLHGAPDLGAVRVEPLEGEWPADFEPLPLAAALWEAGSMALGDFVCL